MVAVRIVQRMGPRAMCAVTDVARNIGEWLRVVARKLMEDVPAHQKQPWLNLSAKHA